MLMKITSRKQSTPCLSLYENCRPRIADKENYIERNDDWDPNGNSEA